VDSDPHPDRQQDELERMLPLGAARGDASRTHSRRGDTTLATEPEPLRSRNAGEILDVALDVMRQRFMVLAGTCTLIWFPFRLVMPFLAPHTWLENPDLQLVAVGLFLLVALITNLAAMMGEAVVAQLTLATLEQRPLALRSAVVYALRRFWGLLGLSVVYGVALYAGFCCMLVPGVFLSWKFWVARPALILERVSIGTAIRRSFELSEGTFGRWLGVAATRLVFVTLLGFTVGMPDDPTLRTVILDAIPISGTVLDVVNVFVSSIFMGTVTALSGVVVTVYYIDCRIRRDGHDLDLELDRIEARHGPVRSAGQGDGTAGVAS